MRKKQIGGPSAPPTKELAALYDAARRARENERTARAHANDVAAQVEVEHGPHLVTDEQDLRRTVARRVAVEAEHTARRAVFAAGIPEAREFARRILGSIGPLVDRAESIPRRDVESYESALRDVDTQLFADRLDWRDLSRLRESEGTPLHPLPTFPFMAHGARAFLDAVRLFAESTPTLSIDESALWILRDKEVDIRARIEAARLAELDEAERVAEFARPFLALEANVRERHAREDEELRAAYASAAEQRAALAAAHTERTGST